MVADIFKKVKDFFTNRKSQKTNDEGGSGFIKEDPYNNKIDLTNAHSWNRETHPNGYEPSFLVADIHYDNSDKDGKLQVTYRDGFTAEYKGISPHDAVEFNNADSKGRWALKNLWKLPYKAV